MENGFKGVQNLNGRPKGSKNVSTTKIRETFQKLVERNLKQLQVDIDSLEPKDRVKTIIELAKFVLPTLKAVDLSASSPDISPIVINLGPGISPEREEEILRDEVKRIYDDLDSKY